MQKTITIKSCHLWEVLKEYDRETLRDIALRNNIKRGRDKRDTLFNICSANIDVKLVIMY